MNIKFIFLFIWLLTSGFSQTHFTIPQNVWRISFNKYISSGVPGEITNILRKKYFNFLNSL